MVLNNFKRHFPLIADDMEEIIELGDTFVDVLLTDGSRLIYDDIDNTIRMLPKDTHNMSKDECGKEFGIRLRRIMHLKGVTELELSEQTGISQPLISGYIRGNNVPGFYNVDKIAKALGCSTEQFRCV